jgi:hypothetical protein
VPGPRWAVWGEGRGCGRGCRVQGECGDGACGVWGGGRSVGAGAECGGGGGVRGCANLSTVSKQTAIKLHVEVGPDHTIRLPDDIPIGPAEVIILVDQEPAKLAGDKSLLGLFAEDAESVDEAMAFVRERRKSWRIRPAT